MTASPLHVDVVYEVDVAFVKMMWFQLCRATPWNDGVFARCTVCGKEYGTPLNDAVQRHMARHAATCGRRE